MPSFVVHGLIPPLVLIASRAFDTRKVLWLLPVTFLPDADFFFGVHRETTGNLFLPLAAGLVAWWLHRAPERRGTAEWWTVACVYLTGHALMDLFAGGVVLFWPLSDRTFLMDVAVYIDTATLEPIYTFDPETHAGAPVISPIYRFLDGPEFAMAAFTGAYFAVLYAFRRLVPASRENQ